MRKSEADRTRKRAGRRLPEAVRRAVAAAQSKKAADVLVLDLRRSEAFADFFLICTGRNVRQLAAIADAIEDALAGVRLRPAHVEGYGRAGWILLDFFDFVVHIFTPETRAFYALERLWGSAEPIEIGEPEPAS